MIKDGIDIPCPDVYGWLPISELPIASGFWSSSGEFAATPLVIEGITTHGACVIAHYRADGDYQDRWVSPSGRQVYRLTHGRLISSEASR